MMFVNLDPAAWAVFVTACFAGIGNILAVILASIKASNNSKILAEGQRNVAAGTRAQISELAETANKIHRLANGNLDAVNQKLDVANRKITELTAVGPSDAFIVINEKLDALTNQVAAIRERQHDLANFLNEKGLDFELKSIAERKA